VQGNGRKAKCKAGSGLAVSDNYGCDGRLVNRMRRGEFWRGGRDDCGVGFGIVKFGVVVVTGKSGSKAAALQMRRGVFGFLRAEEIEFFLERLM
jgi:hypothetical protein